MDPTGSLPLTVLATLCLYLLFLTQYYILPRLQELEQELNSFRHSSTDVEEHTQCDDGPYPKLAEEIARLGSSVKIHIEAIEAIEVTAKGNLVLLNALLTALHNGEAHLDGEELRGLMPGYSPTEDARDLDDMRSRNNNTPLAGGEAFDHSAQVSEKFERTDRGWATGYGQMRKTERTQTLGEDGEYGDRLDKLTRRLRARAAAQGPEAGE
ncbi:MAG: hypothetical protein Q9208_004748 [Pyrenodesmia sp. 3 TL-2023]